MMKLRSNKYFSRSSSKLFNRNKQVNKGAEKDNNIQNGSTYLNSEIKWELRPGGMLVQRRESNLSDREGLITIRVPTVSKWHDISIESTSTFGELKRILSLLTSLEPREQRLLFKGKERDDNEYLHMTGVRDNDKVLLLEDPAMKEMKVYGLAGARGLGTTCAGTISV